MARFRKRRTARASFAPRFKAKRSGRRSSKSSGSGLMMTMAGAMLYGAVREKVSDAIAPVTNKVPLGDIADEAVLGTLGYFIAKKTTGLPHNIAKAALIVESARVGEAVINGTILKAVSNDSGIGIVAPAFKGSVI